MFGSLGNEASDGRLACAGTDHYECCRARDGEFEFGFPDMSVELRWRREVVAGGLVGVGY